MDKIDRYDSLFQYYGEKFKVDWVLLKAQAIVESGLQPEAKSVAGALGISQFIYSTWLEWYDGTPGIQGKPLLNRKNPEASIRAQAAYMAWLYQVLGDDTDMVLAAYNYGITKILKLRRKEVINGIIPEEIDLQLRLPKETRNYIEKVENEFKILKEGR